MLTVIDKAKDKGEIFRILWTDLAKSSLVVRLQELSKLLCVACPVVEPREDNARWLRGRREVEIAMCAFSEDCEGCRVAASRDEVLRLHGKECRERIGVTRMAKTAYGGGATRASSIGRKS